MKNILTAPWMVEMIRTVTNMYDHGWDERNGGNVSLLLEESQVNDYVDGAVLREIPTGFSCPELDGKYFLVTGTGKYFKNVQYAPEINLGLVRLTDGGETAQLLWGFADGGKFTSEFPAHMMSHAERLKVDPQNRVALSPGESAGHDLCPQLGRKGLYPHPLADVYRMHRGVPRWRECTAVDALRHQ